nr:Dihydrofolate reductase [uncultured bacterium]
MKVFIIAAITADGYIARDADHLADWTTREDKRLFVKLTKEAGVIVMGSKTFATIGRALPERRMVVYTRHPEEVAVEGVETTTESPQQLVSRLETEGAKGVAICGGAAIYSLFMAAGVVDELYVSVEPLVFGKGITMLDTPLEQNLSLKDVSKLNDHTVLLHYTTR